MGEHYTPEFLEDPDYAEDLKEYRRGFARHGMPYGAYVTITSDTDIDDYETDYLPFLLPWLETAEMYEVEAFWEGHNEHGETYRVYADHVNNTYVDSYLEAYRGIWDSEEKFAMQDGAELMNIPPKARAYLDPAKLLKDLSHDLFFVDVAKGVAVYWSH